MANKTTRENLEAKFAAGQIPTFADFADIFASSLNQLDDEIRKEADQPLKLKIPATADPKEVLLLYEDLETGAPLWKMQVKDEGLEISRGSSSGTDLIIDTEGNVGIGTADLGSRLSVFGAFSTDFDKPHSLLTLAADAPLSKSSVSPGFGASIAFAAQRGGSNPNDHPAVGGFLDYYLHSMADRFAGRWAFRFRLRDDEWPNNDPHDERSTVMTLAPDGHVGIGATWPEARLVVDGSAAPLNSLLQIKARNRFGQDEKLVVNGNGNVGINTANPQHALEIWSEFETGPPKMDIETSANSPGTYSRATTNWQSFTTGKAEDIGANPYLHHIEVHVADARAGHLIIFEGEGDIPDNKLWIQPYKLESNGYQSIVLTKPIPIDPESKYTVLLTNALWYEGDAYDGGIRYPNRAGCLQMRTYVVDRVTFKPSMVVSRDRVGIGTNSPTEKLEVNGNVKAAEFHGKFFKEDGTELVGAGDSPSPWTVNAGNITLPAGNVGIGTPTPSAKLEVNGQIKATSFQGTFLNADGTDLTSGAPSPWTQNGGNITIPTGNVGIGTTNPLARLQIVSPTTNGGYAMAEGETVMRLYREGVSGGAYPNIVDFSLKRFEDARVEARTQLDISLLHSRVYRPGILNGNNPDTIVMSLRSNGNVGIGTTDPGNDRLDVRGSCYSSGGWNTSNADYAELFESENGKAIPAGTSVVVSGDGKVRPAKKGETPCGVVSARPALVGNSYKEWPGKYLKDEFGAPILEEYQEEVPVPDEPEEKGKKKGRGRKGAQKAEVITRTRWKLNPEYDPTKAYVRREGRPEWVAVGLLGLLALKKGQAVAANWVKVKKISDKVELWLVK